MSTVTINLSMPKSFLDEVDALAREELTTRSDIFRTTVLDRIKKRKKEAETMRKKDKLELDELFSQMESSNVSDDEVLDYIVEKRRKEFPWRNQK
jgi:metal-responsive CopG/Arc/MetJ family transcriptional regulator